MNKNSKKTNETQNLNKLEFNLYRNNQFIGTHIYTFDRDDNKLLVKSVLAIMIYIIIF